MAAPKILVVRFSSIGDIVLTTPVVRCLKQQLNAEVHYLTKQSYAGAIAHNPYIDQVLTIQKDVNEVAEILLDASYDFVVDLHNNLRSLQTKRLLDAKSAAFPKLNVQKWVLVNFKLDLLPAVHIVDRYFKAVSSLGVQNDGKGLDFFYTDEELAEANELMSSGPFVAIAIGAGLPTKCLEPEQIASLCDLLACRVILLGGPDDHDSGVLIARDREHVENYAGKVSLGVSGAIVSQAGLLITPDTGLMHIAAALDKDIISIWGNTVPKFGMTAYHKVDSTARHSIFEIGALPCRPCSKIGYSQCPQGHFKCIREQPLDKISQLSREWLQL